jgi:Protein of unknown function (DUF2889)
MASAAADVVRLERRSFIEIRPEAPPPARAPFGARLVDLVDGAVAFEVRLEGAVDASGVIEHLEGPMAEELLASLVGTNAHRGLRRRLDPLRSDDADERALRRLLFDLPIATMIMMQAFIVKSPGGRRSTTRMGSEIPGVNQCAGWVAGGQMLTLIRDNDGLLEMEPSVHLVGDDHLGDPEPSVLRPDATRRRRRYVVEASPSSIEVGVDQRDSFATPDGVERVLHWWKARLSVRPEDHVISAIEVDNGGLPWVECPSAAGSAQRLVGQRLEDVEDLVGSSFEGVTTCTHLNDTLAALSSVPELIERIDS